MRWCLVLLIAACAVPAVAAAQETAPSAAASRPAIKTNRWQEDWSPLADPAMRTQALDELKYLPLARDTYASLGLNLRERFESNREPAFGIGRDGDAYGLQRLQLFADVRSGQHWQVFTALEDVRAAGKKTIGPADENPLDLRLAFVAYRTALADGTLKLRVGRQDFAFDLQRFVSSRDGPNVRQSFDAAWIDYERAAWRFIAFASHPVQYDRDDDFDDTSNRHFAFHTLRIERHVFGSDELSAYYARYKLDDSHYPDAAGDERRNIFDLRFAGIEDAIDWDVETMAQTGHVGASEVRAWAFGGRAGYTFGSVFLMPRLGLQADVASGDREPGDGKLQTFNPLFPNGYYFALAGYTGHSNLIHLKPSLSLKPRPDVRISAALGLQWRQTTADAIYVQPDVPLAGTSGAGKRWTGRYVQLRADWTISANWSGNIEAVHYDVGDAIRDAGGRDGNYLEVELKLAW